jgi:hypothetical protein
MKDLRKGLALGVKPRYDFEGLLWGKAYLSSVVGVI